VSAPGKWFEVAGAVGRTATLVLLAVVVGRTGWLGLSSLDRQVAALAAQDREITIRGGDVSLRDAPKAHELRGGRLFSDPYYAGEHHWYPFLTPLAAAAVSKLGGKPIPESFFRAEVGFVALYLVSLGVLAFSLLRWRGLLLLPAVCWLGALPAAHGLYPTEAARGGFCLFLAYAARFMDGAPPPRQALALGAFAGVLGLWSGAPFFAAAALVGVIAVRWAVPALRQRTPRALLSWLPPLLVGALVPLALLFGPELLRHGRLAMPDAARTWMSEIYDGGTLSKALTLKLAPGGLHLVLVVLALLRLVAGRWLRLPCWRRAVPLVVAYFGCLLLAHLGFIAADPAHPALASVARGLMPAPAHTFLSTADACRPVVEVLGLAALLELLGLALVRLRLGWRPQWAPLVPALAAAACAALVFTFHYRITRFDASESRAFQRFAARVGQLAGTTPVLFRYPGRLVQGTSVKILKLSVAEYANPYVHAERARDEAALDAALRAGDLRGADAVLDRHRIAFIMEDPRAPADPPIRRCGGEVLAEQDGYRLRRRVPCRM
jgi:hypothetical protein